METSLKATEKATIDAEEGTEVHEVPARSLSEVSPNCECDWVLPKDGDATVGTHGKNSRVRFQASGVV